VHDAPAADQVAAFDVGLLRLRRVHQHRIGIAAPRHLQRGAGPYGDRFDLDAGLPLEHWEQRIEQAGILGAGRRRQDDLAAPLRRGGDGNDGKDGKDGKNIEQSLHGSLRR